MLKVSHLCNIIESSSKARIIELIFKSMAMSKTIHFEKSIKELEQIVSQLESGEQTLEEALKQFEKGIKLARQCQELLSKAEQKIEILSTSNTPQSGHNDE